MKDHKTKDHYHMKYHYLDFGKATLLAKSERCCLYGIFTIVFFILTFNLPVAYGQNAGSNEVADLNQRVTHIEEKLRDMQILIGSLESLIKQQQGGGQTGSASQSGFSSGGSHAGGDRIEALETQIRAMSQQIEQLTLQLQHNSGGSTQSFQPNNQGSSGNNFETKTEDSSIQQDATQNAKGQTSNTGTSNTGTSNTGNDSSPSQLSALPDIATNNTQGQNNQAAQGTQGSQGSQGTASKVAVSEGASQGGSQGMGPEALYNEAYGNLLKRDYATAATGFQQFLKAHGKDKLAGQAQYWLGETYFAQEDYKKAADSFLKGYTKFKSNQKAPDSLLKLALSLEKLGQKDAACSSISELKSKFPQAPENIMNRAETEKKRMKCS